MPRAKPAGSGRKKGSLNKATAEVKSIAQQFGKPAIEMLFDIAQRSKNDTARIAAIKELLDRGYGKSTAVQELSGPGGAPLSPPQLIIQSVSDDE
ncbi:hypothetical protein GS501_00075 [Saccharibacter sp. 17.LH.SD]|uniref:hypothetical protein n=1 Tax=Saccharibacter sp. 17.LH.SD TaxID=2689393 RepID=UPI00136C19C2|nr:hypothetical protein [Saccharibacter sp. 17.LH.SD]MXV43477.1 hypothetical protein [Saccharibacter sp. 17.LH.SD]